MNALPSNAPAYSTLNIATLSQQARLLRLTTELDAELVVEHMSLREGVSRLFSLTLDCLAASAELDVAALLGKEISVSLLQADGSMRRWHAVVEGVDALGADGGLARYRLHAAPWMAALALRRDSFVYQDLSVQDIVSEVFSDYPQAAFAFELTDAPKPRPLCTQYRESDLEFVQRILAEAGLCYRFEHQQDDGQSAGGGARHRVVIFDADAARPEDPSSPLRFHRSDATETSDSITRFAAAQSVRPSSVARAAWNERSLTAHAAQSQSQARVEALPVLEDYDYAGHGRYADDDAAEQGVARSLRAHESRLVRFDGAGTARSLAPGRIFALSQHDRYAQGGGGQAIDELAGNRYVLVDVTHEATNNLGGQAAQVLNTPDMERGTYRNRFSAQPEAAALMPAWRARPTAPEGLAAVVVSANDAPVTSDRDLRVKVQFPWQRGEKPLTGGLPHRTHGDASGNAPGDDRSGTWLRVASAQAGPNWGAHHLPRGGTEVIVEFIDGDIDQPVVAGQLYNDADLPPWSAGENGDANHAGVLSGWHSQGLDGAGRNQWLFDDTKGKLRTRLASSTAATQLGLGHLVEQGLDDASRGQWRGTGFELRSDAWAVVRSGQGMLVSATAREQGKSTQADAQEALLLLRGAQDASRRLNDSASQHQARPLAAAEGYDELIKALDPEQDGRYPTQVNGQSAGKAVNGLRTADAHIERINGPHLLVDAPNTLNLATPASAVLHAGEHLHATAQSDAHVAATQTYAAVSARSASVFAQQGPIRAISAQAPVSLHAHTDILEALAGQDITVTSSAEGIEILGNQRVTLQAAGGSVTLDGADIVFKGPGLFSVKGATHNFVGPGSDAASLPALPSTTVDDPLIVSAELVHKDGAFATAAKKAGASLMAGFGGATGASGAGAGLGAMGDIMPGGLSELGKTAAGAAGKLSQLAGQASSLASMAKNPMSALSAAPGLLGSASPAVGGLLNTAKNTMGLVSQAQAMVANPMSALPAAKGLLGAVAPGAGGMLDGAASAAGAVSKAADLIKNPMSALPAATDMLASVAPEGASGMISSAAGLAGIGAGTADAGAGLGAGADAGANLGASSAAAASATDGAAVGANATAAAGEADGATAAAGVAGGAGATAAAGGAAASGPAASGAAAQAAPAPDAASPASAAPAMHAAGAGTGTGTDGAQGAATAAHATQPATQSAATPPAATNTTMTADAAANTTMTADAAAAPGSVSAPASASAPGTAAPTASATPSASAATSATSETSVASAPSAGAAPMQAATTSAAASPASEAVAGSAFSGAAATTGASSLASSGAAAGVAASAMPATAGAGVAASAAGAGAVAGFTSAGDVAGAAPSLSAQAMDAGAAAGVASGAMGVTAGPGFAADATGASAAASLSAGTSSASAGAGLAADAAGASAAAALAPGAMNATAGAGLTAAEAGVNTETGLLADATGASRGSDLTATATDASNATGLAASAPDAIVGAGLAASSAGAHMGAGIAATGALAQSRAGALPSAAILNTAQDAARTAAPGDAPQTARGQSSESARNPASAHARDSQAVSPDAAKAAMDPASATLTAASTAMERSAAPAVSASPLQASPSLESRAADASWLDAGRTGGSAVTTGMLAAVAGAMTAAESARSHVDDDGRRADASGADASSAGAPGADAPGADAPRDAMPSASTLYASPAAAGTTMHADAAPAMDNSRPAAAEAEQTAQAAAGLFAAGRSDHSTATSLPSSGKPAFDGLSRSTLPPPASTGGNAQHGSGSDTATSAPAALPNAALLATIAAGAGSLLSATASAASDAGRLVSAATPADGGSPFLAEMPSIASPSVATAPGVASGDFSAVAAAPAHGGTDAAFSASGAYAQSAPPASASAIMPGGTSSALATSDAMPATASVPGPDAALQGGPAISASDPVLSAAPAISGSDAVLNGAPPLTGSGTLPNGAPTLPASDAALNTTPSLGQVSAQTPGFVPGSGSAGVAQGAGLPSMQSGAGAGIAGAGVGTDAAVGASTSNSGAAAASAPAVASGPGAATAPGADARVVSDPAASSAGVATTSADAGSGAATGATAGVSASAPAGQNANAGASADTRVDAAAGADASAGAGASAATGPNASASATATASATASTNAGATASADAGASATATPAPTGASPASSPS
ncbi:type VI secretion system tip protein TssI/VgrG, partial [Achromobacter arsenitoxydans]